MCSSAIDKKQGIQSSLFAQSKRDHSNLVAARADPVKRAVGLTHKRSGTTPMEATLEPRQTILGGGP